MSQQSTRRYTGHGRSSKPKTDWLPALLLSIRSTHVTNVSFVSDRQLMMPIGCVFVENNCGGCRLPLKVAAAAATRQNRSCARLCCVAVRSAAAAICRGRVHILTRYLVMVSRCGEGPACLLSWREWRFSCCWWCVCYVLCANEETMPTQHTERASIRSVLSGRSHPALSGRSHPAHAG